MVFSTVVDTIASKINLPKSTVHAVLTAFKDLIKERLLAGEEVDLQSFGKFYPKTIKSKLYLGKRTLERTRIGFSSSKKVDLSAKEEIPKEG